MKRGHDRLTHIRKTKENTSEYRAVTGEVLATRLSGHLMTQPLGSVRVHGPCDHTLVLSFVCTVTTYNAFHGLYDFSVLRSAIGSTFVMMRMIKRVLYDSNWDVNHSTHSE